MATDSTLGALPAWAQDIEMTVNSTKQFLLTGNVHDQYLLPMTSADGSTSMRKYETMSDALGSLLSPLGFEWMALWDPVHGFQLSSKVGAPDRRLEHAQNVLGVRIEDHPQYEEYAPLVDLIPAIRRMGLNRQQKGALVVNYASRLCLSLSQDQAQTHDRLFLNAEVLCHQPAFADGCSPVFWLANEPGDLPPWFVGGNSGLRTITVSTPDRALRKQAAEEVFLEGLPLGDGGTKTEAVEKFRSQTSGLPLRAMNDIWRLARDQGYSASQIDQAARAFRVGLRENHWLKPDLRIRVAAAEASLDAPATDEPSEVPEAKMDLKVFGQSHALKKSLDILKRSALGLASAHTAGNQTRPRGVMFFAGPTGVGKTQLAKAINNLIFESDEPLRFDMSEFSSEHAEARLLGAPPGYVGHEAGGELTKGIRERPFSVVLFDEIEKAHPRLLDKFLQILDDGRLTDGSGQTVYFSEAIIIFTSNLGMTVPKKDGGRNVLNENGTAVMVPRERPETFEELEEELKSAIKQHFVGALGRPELLNRIGEDNIIVFDYITREPAEQIFHESIDNVRRRVASELHCKLHIPADIESQLVEVALEDLSMGGRGIGTMVETSLVNPLARSLFSKDLENATGVELVDFNGDGSTNSPYEVEVRVI